MVGRETTFPFGSRPIFRDKLLVSGTITVGLTMKYTLLVNQHCWKMEPKLNEEIHVCPIKKDGIFHIFHPAAVDGSEIRLTS